MKVVILSFVVFVAIVALAAWSKGRLSPQGDSLAGKRMTLEQKLEVLASCGLTLADPFKPEDLLTSWDRKEFEEPGFDLVLVSLGMTEEQEPWRYHCVNLWHFDTECIEDHGAYKEIAERMSEMAQGSFSLENVQDYVDVEEEKAWLSFSFKGEEIKIDCKVDDDWVDTTIFGRFVELLAASDPSKIFIYYDTGGQDGIIGCVAKDDYAKLKHYGINFVPLT